MEESMEDRDLDVSEEEESAFEEAFNGADLEPEPVEPAEHAEETQEAPAAIPAAFTIEDLKAMLDSQQAENVKTRDRMFGKMGEMQQKIDSARSSVSGFSPKARERLEADFPELAEMLFDGGGEPAAEYQYEPQEDKADKDDKARQARELRFLGREHKDWQAVVASPEFVQWRDQILAPESAMELDSTWDSEVISDRLAEFKTWKATAAKKQQDNASRLESAITPRGMPRGNTPSVIDQDEDDAMMEAFNKRHRN